MYLLLENNMLNLVDPMDRSVLHSQPIASIRVWGVGRDNGRFVIIATTLLFCIKVEKCTILHDLMVHYECVRCHVGIFS